MPSKECEGISKILNSLPDSSGLSFQERRSTFEEQALRCQLLKKYRVNRFPL